MFCRLLPSASEASGHSARLAGIGHSVLGRVQDVSGLEKKRSADGFDVQGMPCG